MFDLELVPVLREDIIYRENDSVIFDTINGKLIELSDSANDIISAVQDGRNVLNIIDDMHMIYDESSYEEVTGFVCEFITELMTSGIIESR